MRRLKLININKKIYTIIFSSYFLFSLFIHNHPVSSSEYLQYENDNSSQHIKSNHNSQFCSACRADGKLGISSGTVTAAPDFYNIKSKNLEQHFSRLNIALLKQTRAPPYIS